MEPSIYRYIWRHTKRDQIILILITLASMPFVYLSLDVPKTIVNQAIGGQNIPADIFGVPVTQVSFLLLMCVVFLTLVMINGLFKYVNNVYRGMVGERMLRRFRFDLYSRILRFPMPHFKRTSSAEIIPMVTSETEPLGGFIGEAFALPAFQGGLLITYLAFIFAQDWLLGLAAIALYPPQMWLIPKLQKKVNALAKQRVRTVRELADRVGETVNGVAEVHAHDTSRFERARVSNLLGRIFDIRYEIYRRKFFIKFLNNFIAQLTPFLFYSIGGYFVIKGELSLGALVAVIAAYKDLAPPWKELLKYYQTKEDIRVKYTQIIEQFQPPFMLDEKLQSDDAEERPLGRDLVASNLQYGDDPNVLNVDGASFRVDLGEHTAVVGPSGSGKSYIGPMVARLVNPTGGSIAVDGVNIADLPEAVVGRRIAYVGPVSYLFTGTIEDNILYGLKHAPLDSATDAGIEIEKQRRAAVLAGTTADDPFAEWINFDSLGVENRESLLNEAVAMLRVVDFGSDIFDIGLNGFVSQDEAPHLTEAILKARRTLREHLGEASMSTLIESFDADTYNVNMSLAENLLFGTPVNEDWVGDSLCTRPEVRSALQNTGLVDDLVDAGRELATIMVDLFSDVEPDSELFERFSFISAEDLPDFASLLNRIANTPVTRLDEADRERLLVLPFRLIVARHRLGIINDSIKERIVRARKLLIDDLGVSNAHVRFFDSELYNPAMTVQDNMLFGKVAYGQAQARERVGDLVSETLAELDLVDEIERLGLTYHVGSAGARLTNAQRQKIAIARALMKKPDLIVFDQATAVFDPAAENRLVERVQEHMAGRGIVWIIDRPEFAGQFDRVLIMNQGRVAAQGVWNELLENREASAIRLLEGAA